MSRWHWLSFPCSFLLVSVIVFSTSGVVAALAKTTCGGWHVVSSPNPGSGANDLYGVSAVSSNDVWTVGDYSPPGGGIHTLVEHWDGSQWSVIPSPNPGEGNYLYGVSALSSNDVWAVGYTAPLGGGIYTLIEHWDVSQWNVIPSPNPGPSVDYLYSISALSSKGVWAVGTSSTRSGAAPTLIEHWNGSYWHKVTSPSPGAFANTLLSVSAISSSNAWAVGVYLPNSSTVYTLTEHWNGSQWKVVPSPSPGPDHLLRSVAQVEGTHQVWTVGYYNNGNVNQTLTETYCQ